ncbi:MAG: ATP-dependent helicase RecG [Pseudomonadota bacterium]|jgi:ATP-dependent DNA helicase RecG
MTAKKPAVAKPGKSSTGIAAGLEKLGLRRPLDFALHLPLRYEDQTHVTLLAEAPAAGPALFAIKVRAVTVAFRPRRQLVVQVEDDSGRANLRFLNFYGSQTKQFERARDEDLTLHAWGELKPGYLGPELVHPTISKPPEDAADEAPSDTLTPQYPTTAGVSQAQLRTRIGKALKDLSLPETLPHTEDSRHLPGLNDALRYLHAPPPDVNLSALNGRSHLAWQRICLEELVAQQLSLRKARLARRQKGAPVLRGNGSLTNALIKRLPFALTHAQERAYGEICADLNQHFPMQRLLQGDVGSGKTIVAALAACQAIEAGYQVAFMAPTELLAEQHYNKLVEWLVPLGIKIAWLSGSQKKSERTAQLSAAASDANLVVGTHALFEDAVDFSKLGLVIIDEQHRFGVAQRLALREKGNNPHQLMMSATPIPRTLAMSYFADLDCSVIDELPPGRTPIRTRLIADTRRDDVITAIRNAIAGGEQCYWVCPLIEESETLELQTAIDTHALLTEALPEYQVGLVHGRLKADEKIATMRAFAEGTHHLLVATTVIEVGVDVPNASLMVIEHAERFGLAQLHQLRGRVGRGARESSCILIYGQPLSNTAKERLRIIYENTDGFEIAQADLQLRGPGELVGKRQSGVPMLRYADLERDADLIPTAQKIADLMLKETPALTELHMDRWFGHAEGFLKT